MIKKIVFSLSIIVLPLVIILYFNNDEFSFQTLLYKITTLEFGIEHTLEVFEYIKGVFNNLSSFNNILDSKSLFDAVVSIGKSIANLFDIIFSLFKLLINLLYDLVLNVSSVINLIISV